MYYKKIDKKLYGFVNYNNMPIYSFSIKITNIVLSPEDRDYTPVSFHDYYYFPENFPNGEWNVTDAGNSEDSNIGPYIATDAGRMVDTYQLDSKNNWKKTGSQVYDTGYLFHGSDGNGNTTGDNNENYSTWGCGRGKNSDIKKVIPTIKFFRNKNGTITVKVEE